MKMWQAFKQWLTLSCVWFTVIALFFILLNLAGDSQSGVNTLQYFRIFPTALCIALVSCLKKWDRMPRWAGILLHYAGTVLAVFLFLFLPVSTSQASTKLLMFVLLTLVYWAIFGLYLLISSRVRKLFEED